MPLLTEESLNDFFLPSQDCIKPVEIIKTNLDSEIRIDNGVHWEIQKDGTETQLEAASISLNDCLACSGCVTTAESVLIGLQSWSEVEATLKAAEKKIIVGSICPQSIASIATSYGIAIDSAFRKLRTLLKSLGFTHVLTTNVGRDVSLFESSNEFMDHYRTQSDVPLLASACPGWICYAEKQKSSLIPTISRIRSPQQLTGVMLKDVITRTNKITRSDVYHVAIMPCFDKKLEASRQEFQVDEARDVDTVITSAEVANMITDSGIDFLSLDEDMQDTYGPVSGRHPGSSSGGYLAHVLTTAAKELFGICISPDLNDPHVLITTQRAPKLKEYRLIDDTGKTLLVFAEAYGFRQITSLCQKLAPKVNRRRLNAKKVEYDYVEVMACESGCINGGGQIRPPDGASNKDWVNQVEARYREEREVMASKDRYEQVVKWWSGYEEQVGLSMDRERLKEKARTKYNEIPPLVNPLASKW